MWSYHVILLFSYLVQLQPYCCRLWFLTAVKLNLSSSILDGGSPRETHREDSNELLVGNIHLFQDWRLGDKRSFNTNHETWHGGWAVCELWLQRRASLWVKRADRALSALLLVFPTACRAFSRKANPFSYHVLSITPRTIMVETGLSATTFTSLLSFLPPL